MAVQPCLNTPRTQIWYVEPWHLPLAHAFIWGSKTCIVQTLPKWYDFNLCQFFKKVNKNENSFFELHAKFSPAGMNVQWHECGSRHCQVTTQVVGPHCGWSDSSGFQMDSLKQHTSLTMWIFNSTCVEPSRI
jgi:hypothetical protein